MPPDGREMIYDKRHLFRMAGEHEHYAAGESRVNVELGDWRVRLSVCYDLRFPVWLRSRGDYDALLCVANWPAARQTAWNTLLRARAVENLCYTIAVNRVGRDGNGVDYRGGSGVYGPEGEALTEVFDRASGGHGVARPRRTRRLSPTVPRLARRRRLRDRRIEMNGQSTNSGVRRRLSTVRRLQRCAGRAAPLRAKPSTNATATRATRLALRAHRRSRIRTPGHRDLPRAARPSTPTSSRAWTPGMPPRGACPACTDQALEAAVDYMVLHAE